MIESPAPQSSPAIPLMARENRQGWILLAISVTAALSIYLPSIWFGPIYDDRILLLSNPLLRSWSGISFYFTHHMWSNIDPGKGAYYRPLLMSTYIAISKLSGGKIWAFHAAAVFLFLCTTTATFFLARELGVSPIAAGCATLLFAVHPLHIEVAAMATTGIGENLAAIPFVLALASYFRAQRLGRWSWFALAASCYVVALLTKESTVILPLLAVLAEFFRRPSEKKSAAFRITVLFVITGAYLFIRSLLITAVVHSLISLPLKIALLTIPSLVVFYLRQLVLPLNVSMFYDSYYVETISSLRFLLPCLLLLGLVLLLWIGRKRGWLNNAEAFCGCAVFVSLAPILNVRTFQWREFAHDRFAHLASIFLLLLLASVLSRLAKMRTLILAGLALFFAILCESQVWNYKDEFSAFSHACQVAPNNANALAQMALVLHARGHQEEARMLLHRTVLLSPGWYDAHHDLAQMDLEAGLLDDAEMQARQAISLMPQRAQAHSLLARILEQEGKSVEAQQELKLAQTAPLN